MLPFDDLPASLGPRAPDGLRYRPGLLNSNHQAALIAHLAPVTLAPFRFQGWLGKRLTASFGWQYDFDEARFAPAAPLPDWALVLRARAATAAEVDPQAFVQLLVTRYDPGAAIGWHRDRPVFDQVIGISLGAPATLRFRRRVGGRFDRFALPLEPGSLYRLSGAVRQDWEHGIEPLAQTRWSLTFRSLSAAGLAIQRGLDGA
jgi:alkylated DNA repair protein (DNA oxidative demethylase)